MGFTRFMATGVGRGARIAAGSALVAIGLMRGRGGRGAVLALVGLAPILAGTFDVCVLAPLLRVPFKGSDVRIHDEGPSDARSGAEMD